MIYDYGAGAHVILALPVIYGFTLAWLVDVLPAKFLQRCRWCAKTKTVLSQQNYFVDNA